MGTENAGGYVTAAIDTQTNLYHVHNTYPGTVSNISQGPGVSHTGISGHFPAPGTGTRSLSGFVHHFRPLLDRLAPAPAAGAVTQADWANLPSWVGNVLEGGWSIAFGSVTASEATADAFWHLTNASNESVRVHVVVLSVTGANGALDIQASARAARDRVLATIGSSDRDPEGVWATGTFNDFGDYSLQYAADLAAGRVIVVAVNTVVDIAGQSSTSALDGIARQLFGYAVRRGAPALAFPVLEYQDDGDMRTVHGLGAEFSVIFSVVGQLSVAGATCEDAGVVKDDYIVTEVDGWNSTVEFKFVAKEPGRHVVRIHCADMLTMICATRALQINVVADDASA